MTPPDGEGVASTASISSDVHAQLMQYTACDVSDALLKLHVPGAGHIPDLHPYGAPAAHESIVVAPVSTILFAPKGDTLAEPPSNMPDGVHWADLTCSETIVIMKQPPGQTNAVCGGIMALRMKARRVAALIVAGRVRDLTELRATGLAISAYGTSTVGAGAATVPWALQVPLDINGVMVRPGDVALHDPVNGVVVIPRDKIPQVLELLPKLTTADDKVKEDVLKGVSVHEAFKRHRGA
ncbi:menaquinone methyltransferase [Drechmeria coniospora]|uniref:Menaquinone methyltransferase n=1 Tax=Drechmeria coniospora TaxID=98403 RepID=A0A151GD44_DRECN|nr:menaquinone methyltransferase [Drechmeria coniospora]KYK55032.1 menaquinone methyltransferase [Drechmeria coniospora]ODA82339.1 hypothetical protein RJ55_00846 [Drechmeria coniospora]